MFMSSTIMWTTDINFVLVVWAYLVPIEKYITIDVQFFLHNFANTQRKIILIFIN